MGTVDEIFVAACYSVTADQNTLALGTKLACAKQAQSREESEFLGGRARERRRARKAMRKSSSRLARFRAPPLRLAFHLLRRLLANPNISLEVPRQ